MKLSKSKLKQIIKEELKTVLNEYGGPDYDEWQRNRPPDDEKNKEAAMIARVKSAFDEIVGLHPQVAMFRLKKLSAKCDAKEKAHKPARMGYSLSHPKCTDDEYAQLLALMKRASGGAKSGGEDVGQEMEKIGLKTALDKKTQ